MINPKLLESNFDEICTKLIKRGVENDLIGSLQQQFTKNKTLLKEIEGLRGDQKSITKQFAFYKLEKKDVGSLQQELTRYKERIADKQKIYNEQQEVLQQLLATLPNLPEDTVPGGQNETDNVELKKVLTPTQFNFKPKAHYDLAISNGWIDFERGVKIAKSRFSAFKGVGATLNRALINYMLDFNISKGYNEVRTPFIANKESLFSTGQLPKFTDDLFKIEQEPLYLIPTSEVTLVNLYRDEILPLNQLPIRMSAYSPCFRREAGSAGRDTRGIMRQHQFEKVELVSLCHPNTSSTEFDMMVQCVSNLLSSLQLPHRLMQLCCGDMGFSAAKTIDIEVWIPSENKYREISSISNTHDFQARRAKIRYKNEQGKNELIHTLNGSSLAIGRTIIAIMENHQDSQGNINLPQSLHRYMPSY